MSKRLLGYLRGERSAAPRIVVVGANFAGLNLALHLPRAYQVTVVDPWSYFEFLPNIHELVSGLKTPADLRIARAPLLQRAGHAFVLDRAVAIDLPSRRLQLAGGMELAYDVLALAVGGEGTTRGVQGAAEHALSFRSVADCQAIGARLRRLRIAPGEARPQVVIVGGGLEGVEALGEILRAFRDELALTVVESRPKLLPEVQLGLDHEILRRCAGLPVRVLTDRRVQQISSKGVLLGDGEKLAADLVIWTGGLIPSPLLSRAGLAPADGWATVHPTLQSAVDERVFVVGDAAELPTPLSKQAYHALDMGRCAAGNIQRLLRDQALVPFSPADKPLLVSLGDLDTFLISQQWVLAGAALSTAKEAVYQLVMSQLDVRRGVGGVLPLLRRSGKGLADLALANLSSRAALVRSLDLRVLR